jgi:hypothetical protein
LRSDQLRRLVDGLVTEAERLGYSADEIVDALRRRLSGGAHST